jgi:hypothetical protein
MIPVVPTLTLLYGLHPIVWSVVLWVMESKKVCRESNHFRHKELAMTDTRKTYEAYLDAQFDKWNAQIALLKAKAD